MTCSFEVALNEHKDLHVGVDFFICIVEECQAPLLGILVT